MNGIPRIKDGYNPATWMLEITTAAQEDALGINFTDIYRNWEPYRRNKALVKDLSTTAPGSKDLYFPTSYSQPFLSQLRPVAAVERTVFYRERATGMYSALPYAFGQRIIYGVMVYSMMGFEWTASKFFWYLFFMYFTFLYFSFYGMMTVAVTPNHNIAGIVSSFFYGIWNLFSGFLIPRTRIPIWWRWYYWFCPFAWTLYGLIASQFGDVKDKFESGETVEQFLRSYFDFRDDFVGVVAIIIVGICILFAFIYAYSIKTFNFQQR
ncbi:ABC-2 type transporter [Theobroma cacao]|nr:ABC-2 type transporter [Theobroma cacao]